jgi:hypothetical protein
MRRFPATRTGPSIRVCLKGFRGADYGIELRIRSIGDFRLRGNLRAKDVVGALESFRESGGVL